MLIALNITVHFYLFAGKTFKTWLINNLDNLLLLGHISQFCEIAKDKWIKSCLFNFLICLRLHHVVVVILSLAFKNTYALKITKNSYFESNVKSQD